MIETDRHEGAAEGRWSAVGSVRTDRLDPADTDHWGATESTIVLHPRFGPHALTGLEEFSHVEVVFAFHLAAERGDYTATRRPRGRADLPPVGVFASRGPFRPNLIGTTICEIVSVQGRELRVRRLDAVDGTPVLDLKPVLSAFVPASVHEPAWATTLMADYW